MSKNLVIVRADDDSLHPEWLAPGRDWDLLVSGFGKTPPQPQSADIVHYVEGAAEYGPFDGVHRAIADNEEYVFSHERIMLADDDIRMNAADISATFELGEALDLRLYQPSVIGPVSWRHLSCRRDSLIRYVSLVELMIPVLHRDILRSIWRDFAAMKNGFGLDLCWGVFAGFPHIAVLDCVPVTHTRPVGGNKRWGWSIKEIYSNTARRCAPRCPPILIRFAHLYLGQFIAVRNDLRVEYCSRISNWRTLPPKGASPQWTSQFHDYAADKDFEVLRRLDRRGGG